jgi:hypothetical protein
MGANVPHIALENPVGAISTRIRKPDCVVHPWQYGHPESKTTCLWLKNLPALNPTNVLQKPESGRWENQTPSGQNKLAPSKNRWKERSKTYKGIAQAMAERVRIVFAHELPECECCGEPWCAVHLEHYADCDCIGPHNAEDEGYRLVDENGTIYGLKP